MLAIIMAASTHLYAYYDPQYRVLAFSPKGGMCRIEGKEAYDTYNLGDGKCYKMSAIMFHANMMTIDRGGDPRPEEIYTYYEDRGWVTTKK